MVKLKKTPCISSFGLKRELLASKRERGEQFKNVGIFIRFCHHGFVYVCVRARGCACTHSSLHLTSLKRSLINFAWFVYG